MFDKIKLKSILLPRKQCLYTYQQDKVKFELDSNYNFGLSTLAVGDIVFLKENVEMTQSDASIFYHIDTCETVNDKTVYTLTTFMKKGVSTMNSRIEELLSVVDLSKEGVCIFDDGSGNFIWIKDGHLTFCGQRRELEHCEVSNCFTEKELHGVYLGLLNNTLETHYV